MTADGQLDWYFEPIATDRYTAAQGAVPGPGHPFVRNNVTYFAMNERKPPFDKLAVRQAVNYAIDRTALVKIFGGQGTPTENILPPGIGQRVQAAPPLPATTSPRPRRSCRRRATPGMAVDVWTPHHRSDAEGRAVPRRRARRRSASRRA